jgi:hypothetical protein
VRARLAPGGLDRYAARHERRGRSSKKRWRAILMLAISSCSAAANGNVVKVLCHDAVGMSL